MTSMTSSVKPEAARPVTPIGILVSHLETAMQQLVDVSNLPPGLAANVQEALNLAQGLDSYISDCTTPESSALEAIAHQTSQEPWTHRFGQGETVRQLEQEMLSGHVEGQTLKMFVYMTRARRILDIGMFTGYSALAMAEALPTDGQLIACEVDSYVATFAQNLFGQSAHGSKIQIELGSALETLDRLANVGELFDLVFIDADKQEYVQYFQMLLDRNLLAPNGFICVDNTLFQGQVYLPKVERSSNGEAIVQFNQIVQQDDRVEQVLLPLRDGLTIIRRV